MARLRWVYVSPSPELRVGEQASLGLDDDARVDLLEVLVLDRIQRLFHGGRGLLLGDEAVLLHLGDHRVTAVEHASTLVGSRMS